jgi:tRNA(Ile)-lysidine synthase
MQLIRKVAETIKRYSMISEGEHVLTALSGGPDSVCLLQILSELRNEYKISLSAIYVDHRLRPDETPFEADFCKKICNALNIPLLSKSIDVLTFAQKEGINKQEAARELRYRAFHEAADELKADKIALGHNRDDQAETVLIRLIRGSGPTGLSAIPPVRGKIIRPLIEIQRMEIEDFLDKKNIPFVVDSSNLTDRYLRNKLRHVIMPELKKINPAVSKTISRTSDIFRDEERYFDIAVAKSLMKMISRKNDRSIELFIAPMEILDTVILRRVLRRAIDATKGLKGISFLHIEDIINLIRSGRSGDRIFLPNGIRVIKEYSLLKITSEEPKKLATYAMEKPGEVRLPESSMTLFTELIDCAETDGLGDGKRIAVINADRLIFPLSIRARKRGDYFFPLGFGRRKKLQDYFVDEKIPRDEREAIPLLINGNEEIVWIVGHRIDERYKIEKNTKKILKCLIKY